MARTAKPIDSTLQEASLKKLSGKYYRLKILGGRGLLSIKVTDQEIRDMLNAPSLPGEEDILVFRFKLVEGTVAHLKESLTTKEPEPQVAD